MKNIELYKPLKYLKQYFLIKLSHLRNDQRLKIIRTEQQD